MMRMKTITSNRSYVLALHNDSYIDRMGLDWIARKGDYNTNLYS